MTDLSHPTGAAAAPGDELQPVEPPDDHECAEDDTAARGGNSAAERGWGPGWPNDNSGKMRVVRAGGVAVSVHRGIAPLVDWLLGETVRRGYQPRHGECWGFANRAIRGSNKPSNHSWGLAVDINAPANPMGSKLVTDMPDWMPELWKSKGFRWGGDYRTRPDAMHYEFMGSPDDAERAIASLTVADDLAPADRPRLRKDDKGPWVERLQTRLNAHGTSLQVDGVFGPKTDEAVRAFQEEHDLEVDGIVGPVTWAALE